MLPRAATNWTRDYMNRDERIEHLKFLDACGDERSAPGAMPQAGLLDPVPDGSFELTGSVGRPSGKLRLRACHTRRDGRHSQTYPEACSQVLCDLAHVRTSARNLRHSTYRVLCVCGSFSSGLYRQAVMPHLYYCCTFDCNRYRKCFPLGVKRKYSAFNTYVRWRAREDATKCRKTASPGSSSRYPRKMHRDLSVRSTNYVHRSCEALSSRDRSLGMRVSITLSLPHEWLYNSAITEAKRGDGAVTATTVLPALVCLAGNYQIV
jgi:hypothetical protein